MRLSYITTLGMAAVSMASAASVATNVFTVGSAVSGNSGLTSGYVNGNATSCVGFTVQGNTCITPGAPVALQRNFDVTLFSGATPAATPYGGYHAGTQGVQTAGGLMGANGSPQFSMMSDAANPVTGTSTPNSNDFWDLTSNSSLITVAVGLTGVTDVWTMLNNIYGTAGANSTTVFLDFGTSSNVVNASDIIQVNLTNSGAAGSGASGQIQDANICAANGPNSVGGTFCTGLDVGPTAAFSTPTTLVGGVTQETGITVGTKNLFSTAYTGTSNAGIYKSTTGNVDLNAQDFQISSLVGAGLAAQFEGLYLVDIRVKENIGGAGVSQTALTAITIDTVPEPSTVLLFVGGLGAIGLLRRRRLS